MPVLRYTPKALQDLREIAVYTLAHWGDAQVTTYIETLEDACSLLARNPSLGRLMGARHPSWRRFEQASHIILYRHVPGGVRIQRIIHKRQLIDHPH